MIGHGGVANPKNGHKTGGEGSISLQYASTQGQQRLQNGRPQDKAKLCFGVLGEKTHENTLWNPCEVKLRVRRVPYWVPWRSGGRDDRIARILMMWCFGIFSLGVSWAIWGLCLSESMLA